MSIHTNPHESTTNLDISSRAFWSQTFEQRDETFAELRAEAPVSWQPPIEDQWMPPEVHGETGFWAVTRAEDITWFSQHHEIFSSELGGTSLHPYGPGPRFEVSFLDMDPPRHTAYRKVLSSAFTPKAVAKLADKIAERSRRIIEDIAGAGEIDFVTEVAAKLPMQTVADLIGIPESRMAEFAEAGNNLILMQDPAALPAGTDPAVLVGTAFSALTSIGTELAAARRDKPEDDVMSALVHADIEGVTFDGAAIFMVMILLSVAGNDTTKQTTTSTLLELDRNPDQRAWLVEDFDGRIMSAVEEFVRHASPVICFARTATRDIEVGDRQIQQGDKVGLFYCSGNRDERVFNDPHRFDLSRGRSPHVGFGGGGVHYCLGNGVAKLQLRALFKEILTRLPDIKVGEPDYLHSDFINGIKHLPVTIK